VTAAQRLPGGKILIPFRIADGDQRIAEGMTEISPGHPEYAEWDAYLTAVEAAEPAAGPAWRLTGIIDTGERVTIGWDGGITECPPDALDWVLAAAAEDLVDAADGPGLASWLFGQGFEPAT
jgi:hypothetical protein